MCPALCSAAVACNIFSLCCWRPGPQHPRGESFQHPGAPQHWSCPATQLPLFWAGTKSEGTAPSAGTLAEYFQANLLPEHPGKVTRGQVTPPGNRKVVLEWWCKGRAVPKLPTSETLATIASQRIGGARVLLRNTSFFSENFKYTSST